MLALNYSIFPVIGIFYPENGHSVPDLFTMFQKAE